MSASVTRRCRFFSFCVLVLALVFSLPGCGKKTVTVPSRSATEQLLLSAAADRAIDDCCELSLDNQKVFLDPSSIDTVDKTYVTAQWSSMLERRGGLLQQKAEDAELVIKPRTAALSIDRSDWLLGLPEMTLPVPLAGDVQTPELALFKLISHKAIAKFGALGQDSKDGSIVFDTGHKFGRSRERSYWFFFLGPFTFTDVTDDAQQPYQPRE